MSEVLYTLAFFAFFGVVLWKTADRMARVAPRDSFLLVIFFRWFVAIALGCISLLHLLIPRDDSFLERVGVALLLFPLGGLMFLTLHETLLFIGMALRASRLPNEALDLLPDHWFDRRLERFIRRRLWLSRVLDLMFRTNSHARLAELIAAHRRPA